MTLASGDSIRADQWLWAARFFKTRSLAKQAIEGGKIEVNGARCKPAKQVKVGDVLRISRGQERLEISVIALAEKRGPASVAVGLYHESEASQQRRERELEALKIARQAYSAPVGRPDKRERRELAAFEQRQASSDDD